MWYRNKKWFGVFLGMNVLMVLIPIIIMALAASMLMVALISFEGSNVPEWVNVVLLRLVIIAAAALSLLYIAE